MQNLDDQSRDPFWIEDFKIDPDTLSLEGPSGKRFIEPKIMRILQTLAAQAGELVTRQTLLDTVWDESYPSDESLTRAISILRKSFGDAHGRRNVIETVPRKGYRLIGNVSYEPPSSGVVVQFDGTGKYEPEPEVSKRPSITFMATLAIVVFATLSMIAAIFSMQKSKTVTVEAPYPTVAVLPFVSLSLEPEDRLFADGLSEELLNTLSGATDLKVAARTSSFAYKNKSEDVKQIGETLGVGYVLEGSIRRSDDRMRITAQLVSTLDGYHLWSDSYDRNVDDFFTVQNDIASHVAEALNSTLATKIALSPSTAGTESADAFQNYLQGRDYLNRRGLGLAKAITNFQQAIEIDPDYARAYAGLATAHAVSHIYLDVPKVVSQQRARDNARRALAINPGLSEPYAVLGVIEADNNNWRDAIDFYEKGEELDPENVVVLQWHAEALTYLGYINQAENKIQRALEVDPESAVLYLVAALIAQNKGDIDETARRYRRSEDLGLSDGVNGNSFVEFERGNIQRAASMMALASFNDQYISEDQVDDLTLFFENIMSHTAKVDDTVGAFPVLAADDDFLTPAYLMSGESEKALRLLEADPDGDHDSFYLLWTNTDPYLRQHPYFKTFAKNTGLYDFWVENGWPDKCKPARGDDYECK